MTGGQSMVLRLTMYLVVLTLVAVVELALIVVELALIGQPPKHCHYFVPVIGHAHIYSCSEYPRPVRVRP